MKHAVQSELAARGITRSHVAALLVFLRGELRQRGVRRVSSTLRPSVAPSRLGPAALAMWRAEVAPTIAVELEDVIADAARAAGLLAAQPAGVLFMLSPTMVRRS